MIALLKRGWASSCCEKKEPGCRDHIHRVRQPTTIPVIRSGGSHCAEVVGFGGRDECGSYPGSLFPTLSKFIEGPYRRYAQ